MAYLDQNVKSFVQNVDGYIILYSSFNNTLNVSGLVDAYLSDIDTRNGGVNQNEV
jgi:hypothetical protein